MSPPKSYALLANPIIWRIVPWIFVGLLLLVTVTLAPWISGGRDDRIGEFASHEFELVNTAIANGPPEPTAIKQRLGELAASDTIVGISVRNAREGFAIEVGDPPEWNADVSSLGAGEHLFTWDPWVDFVSISPQTVDANVVLLRLDPSQVLQKFESSVLKLLVLLVPASLLATIVTSFSIVPSIAAPLQNIRHDLVRANPSLEGLLADAKYGGNEFENIDNLLQDINKLRLRAERAEKNATAASRAKSQFLSNASHELRTPLNGILGMSELLLLSSPTSDQSQYAHTIQSSARELQKIVEELLAVSSLNDESSELVRTRFAVSELLEEVAEKAQAVLLSKSIDVVLTITKSVPEQITHDRNRILQTLDALFSNAVKFTAAGNVELKVCVVDSPDRGHHVQFEVIDTGIGIAASDPTTLFRRFTQADDSDTRRYGGLGLGLALARDTVDLLGGELRVESEVNKGSRFWFDLAVPELA